MPDPPRTSVRVTSRVCQEPLLRRHVVSDGDLRSEHALPLLLGEQAMDAVVQHRVVRYDRLGTGMSDRPTSPPDNPLDEHVETIATLLGHLGQADAALLGL
jgi:pimeloyl-ACP methyl ester carboxylesterase